MNYKDKNNNLIEYGDILINDDLKGRYFVLTPKGMYVSGMDEFVPIEECKLKTDKIDELKAFEVFVHKKCYEYLLGECRR